MILIRVQFNANVNRWARGEAYDVEPTEAIRHLVESGMADIVAYPEHGTVASPEEKGQDE